MKTKLRLAVFICLGALAAGLPTPSQAAMIYDTGVGLGGSSLAAGSVDPHYTLDGGNAVVVDGTSFPIPPWLDYSAANGNSRWISVDSAGGTATLPVADHTYLTTFTLSSVPSSIVLSGKWSGDNASDVYLNGHLLGSQAFQDANGYSYTHYNSFSTADASFFASGLNTLTFTVHNGDVTQPSGDPGGWFGLRTEGLTLTAVPEPTTVFAGIGALGLLLFGAGVHSKRSVLRIGK